MDFGTDRRKFPRAEANFAVIMDTQPSLGESILVKDISKAGVCCLLDTPIPVMTEVRLRLQIPRENGAITEVSCDGAVVRCDPSSSGTDSIQPSETGNPSYEVAIFFVHVTDEGREVIDDYVHSRLEQKAVRNIT